MCTPSCVRAKLHPCPTPLLLQCAPVAAGPVCQKATGQAACDQCVGASCTRCRIGWSLDRKTRCHKGFAGNPLCAAWSPNGHCAACRSTPQRRLYLIPTNARFLNAGPTDSQARPLAGHGTVADGPAGGCLLNTAPPAARPPTLPPPRPNPLQCLTLPELAAAAKDLTGKPLSIPYNCIELTAGGRARLHQ